MQQQYFIQPFSNSNSIQQDAENIMQSKMANFENSYEDHEMDELDQFAGKLEEERAGTQRLQEDHGPAMVR